MNRAANLIGLSNHERTSQNPKIAINRMMTIQLFMETRYCEMNFAEVSGHETHQNDLNFMSYLGQITFKRRGIVLRKYVNYCLYVNMYVWA